MWTLLNILLLFIHSLWQGVNLNQQSTVKTAHVCAYHCAQLSYTAQHKTVLIIFPLNLQTIIIAQTLSMEERDQIHLSLRNFSVPMKAHYFWLDDWAFSDTPYFFFGSVITQTFAYLLAESDRECQAVQTVFKRAAWRQTECRVGRLEALWNADTDTHSCHWYLPTPTPLC